MAKPVFSLSPMYGQSTIELRSPEKIKKWAEGELEFWAPLEDVRKGCPLGPEVSWDELRIALQRIVNAISTNSENWEDVVQDLGKQALAKLHFTSKDPRALHLRDLHAQGVPPRVTGSLLALWVNWKRALDVARQSNQWATDIASATALHQLFARLPDPAAAAGALKEFESARDHLAESVDSNHSALKDAEEALREWKGEAEGTLGEKREDLATAKEEFVKALTDLKKKYDETFAVTAPAEYWKNKERAHRKVSYFFAGLFLSVLGGGGYGAYILTVATVVPIFERATAGSVDGAGVLWPIAVFSVIIAVWAWPLRLTSKLYLSNGHLAEDAAEREIIVRTYLALNQKDELDAEDRRLFLVSIFRQTTVGLVKDDGGLSPAEMMYNRIATR